MKFEIGEIAILHTKETLIPDEYDGCECEIISGPHDFIESDRHITNGPAYRILVAGKSGSINQNCLRKKRPPDIEETRQAGLQSWDKMMDKLKIGERV